MDSVEEDCESRTGKNLRMMMMMLTTDCLSLEEITTEKIMLMPYVAFNVDDKWKLDYIQTT